MSYNDEYDADDDYDYDDDYDDAEDEETVPCPYCRELIHEDAQRCPFCENYISAEDTPSPRKPWWIILGFILSLAAATWWIII